MRSGGFLWGFALPRTGIQGLLLREQPQKPFSPRVVIVGLEAQETAKDRDILLSNELFQGSPPSMLTLTSGLCR
jgi:hypothetical protein